MDAWLWVLVGGAVLGALALAGRALGRLEALCAVGDGLLRASGVKPRT
jgi:hypothetical protein